MKITKNTIKTKKSTLRLDITIERTWLRKTICACKAKTTSKEESWEEEKLQVMRTIIRVKAECVQEYQRELLKCDAVIVIALYGDKCRSCWQKHTMCRGQTKKTGLITPAASRLKSYAICI